METLLIVLVIVGTMIALATRLSLYLYKSGVLEHHDIRRLRRAHPVAVGAMSKGIPANEPSYLDLIEKDAKASRRVRIALLLGILLFAIFAVVMISLIIASFS